MLIDCYQRLRKFRASLTHNKGWRIELSDLTVWKPVFWTTAGQRAQKPWSQEHHTLMGCSNVDNRSAALCYSIIDGTRIDDWSPPTLLLTLLPDLITRMQNFVFCQKNGIQHQRTHNTFQHSYLCRPVPRAAVSAGGLIDAQDWTKHMSKPFPSKFYLQNVFYYMWKQFDNWTKEKNVYD